MELLTMPQVNDVISSKGLSSDKPFIQANTQEISLSEINDKHIIPVFIKDNEPVISQVDFINATAEIVSDIYFGETILTPAIRVSHPVMGRIPEARNKAANELLEHEKTLYYERMAFVIEIPSVYDEIGGNQLSLMVGGVKAHNNDNLYTKKGSDEHFKVFIGFQNSVCTNLCIWTDGYLKDLKVTNIGQLKACIRSLLESYNINFHLHQMRQLVEYSLTEKQFALLIGKCRIYNYLSADLKANIPAFELGDSQINAVCKDYFKDESFCRDEFGNINLWKLYNLFTGANKSSYIDNFIDRTVSAYQFVEGIRHALATDSNNWFLN